MQDNDETYLSGPDVDRRYAISSVTRWRRVKAGILPQPVIFSPGARPRWRLSELKAREQQALDARPEPAHAA